MQSLENTLADITDEKAMEAFLIDLCTPAERRALTERWIVAQLLIQGELSYREINAKTGVSTTTIGRVARFLKDEPYGGYRLALTKTDNKITKDVS
ncbi:Trp operon repressor family [Litorimonas taeanensis]|uniref:Trp operon repressor family n=1 Tax=Litorimonas taeanensis TaxID=568099 RepID=A0A420WKD3_9PROT|nr:Trp family transcriptional regulator [Litorimonas taeanensis]RKQ71382.1 Trp operon repressor family [Litorimonas taeanensis]